MGAARSASLKTARARASPDGCREERFTEDGKGKGIVGRVPGGAFH